jgi:hypothetical protein
MENGQVGEGEVDDVRVRTLGEMNNEKMDSLIGTVVPYVFNVRFNVHGDDHA